MTGTAVIRLVRRLEAGYPDAPFDRVGWMNACATDPGDELDAAATWWLEHHPERPPSPADLRWAWRTQLNPNVRQAIADARAVIRATGDHPMNIGEAQAVNVVLRRALGLAATNEEGYRDACRLLADKARRVLGAGLGPDDVDQILDRPGAG